MIKAVIFDVGGVLIKDPEKEREEYIAFKLNAPVEQFVKAYKKMMPEFTMGKISEDEFWGSICSELKLQKPAQDSLWQEALVKSYEENRAVFEIAAALRFHGYKLGIISNTELPSLEYFKDEYERIFDKPVYSCEVGFMKPQPEIFRQALKNLNITAEEAVYIDDKKGFAEAAEKLGMKSIVFKNADQMASELLSYSVMID